MAEADKDLDIVIEDDVKAPEVDDIQVVRADEPPAKVEEKTEAKVMRPEEGLEALKAQLDRERAARADAEKRANEAATTAYQAKNEVQDTNLTLVTNAIDTVKQNTDILKAHYRDAMSTGDFERAADVQSEMAMNAAKLLQLENGREALKSQPKYEQPSPYQSDPVEALASQLSPKSGNWVRAHPEAVSSDRMYQKMLAAHNLAIADGIPPDSDEYFETIEDIMKLNPRPRYDHVDEPTQEAAKPVQRRSAPPEAPVTRSGAAPGARPNTVRLSSAEREMAEIMGMTDQEYARNKLALQKDGRLN